MVYICTYFDIYRYLFVERSKRRPWMNAASNKRRTELVSESNKRRGVQSIKYGNSDELFANILYFAGQLALYTNDEQDEVHGC